MLLAVAFGILSRYFSAIIWLVVLNGLGATNLIKNLGQLLYIYAKSWMGRYIPGTAPWILGKIHFASKFEISKKKLAIGSLLEGAIEIVAVMAFSFVILIFDRRLNTIDTSIKLMMGISIVILLILLIPKVFNSLAAKAYLFLRKERLESEHLANGDLILKASTMYIVSAIINGISLFFIAKSVYPGLGYHTLVYVMSVGNLAGAVGMLAIFVPSGIGVRDGLQLVLLTAIMPKEVALLITVVTRLLGVVMDLLFFGLSYTTRSHLKIRN